MSDNLSLALGGIVLVLAAIAFFGGRNNSYGKG